MTTLLLLAAGLVVFAAEELLDTPAPLTWEQALNRTRI